jgi:hypothetical protein
MGFMLGHLFRVELQHHLNEATFDALVQEALAITMPQLDRPAFEAVYTFTKHRSIGRTDRWRIAAKGKLPWPLQNHVPFSWSSFSYPSSGV